MRSAPTRREARRASARLAIPLLVAHALCPSAPVFAGAEGDADRALYVRYCAACHGKDGEGDGFVAPALAKPPADLTRLARTSGNAFPLERVLRTIDGRDTIRAHGRGDMPVWGEVFATDPLNDRLEVRMKVRRIAEHLRAIQK